MLALGRAPGILLRRLWRFLGRAGVASWLLFLLLLVSVFGSVVPQLPLSVRDHPERLAAWRAAAQERYGPAAASLERWGAFGLFRSPGYAALVSLAILSILSCTLGRWRGVRQRALHGPVRGADALFAQPLTLPPCSLAQLRGVLEERGFRVRTEESGGTTHLRADRYALSGLATLVTHLAVLLLLAGYALTTGWGWQGEREVAPGQVAEVGRGTDLALRNDGFAIQRYPDGSVADYQAQVTLLEGGKTVAQGTVRVNGPLRYRGLGVFLQGFRHGETGTTLVLQVVHDPGRSPALVGGLLLLAAAALTVYLPHQCLYARLEQERTLLVARPSEWGSDPEAELAALAQELARC